MENKKLQLSLKTKWFEMTKAEVKTEDYREITPYWCNRLLLWKNRKMHKDFWELYYLSMYGENSFKQFFDRPFIHEITPAKINVNVMTLGYPSKNDANRILKLEHKGIEITTGKPEWGAEPNKIYFVIKHGKILKN